MARLYGLILRSSAVLLIGCSWLFSQNPQVRAPRARRFPTVLFTSVLWTADPAYYSIALDSTGTATYESLPESVGQNGTPYTMEFQVSDRTRRIAFNLAQELNFFAGLPNEPMPSPQTNRVHTLGYLDSTFSNQFTYGSASNPNLEEITSVFEEISETFESGRRLAYVEQHDRNAVAQELQHLENQTEHRRMREFQALVPILRRVAGDGQLGVDVRARAQKLLKLAESLR